MTITPTQADRDIAVRFIPENFDGFDELAQLFALHAQRAREQALDEAERAIKAAQYDPAPYTKALYAIRALKEGRGDE